MNNQNWKGKKNKSRQTAVRYFVIGSGVDGGRCGSAATGRDRNDGIGLVGGSGSVGGRVCGRHQNILKLMSSLHFSQL